jgi:hypothetical protein
VATLAYFRLITRYIKCATVFETCNELPVFTDIEIM